MAKNSKTPDTEMVPCLIINNDMIEAGLSYYRQAKDQKGIADGAVVLGVFMAMVNALEGGNIVFNMEGQPTTPFRYDANALQAASKLIIN